MVICGKNNKFGQIVIIIFIIFVIFVGGLELVWGIWVVWAVLLWSRLKKEVLIDSLGVNLCGFEVVSDLQHRPLKSYSK